MEEKVDEYTVFEESFEKASDFHNTVRKCKVCKARPQLLSEQDIATLKALIVHHINTGKLLALGVANYLIDYVTVSLLDACSDSWYLEKLEGEGKYSFHTYLNAYVPSELSIRDALNQFRSYFDEFEERTKERSRRERGFILSRDEIEDYASETCSYSNTATGLFRMLHKDKEGQ